jgi:hypothetical protein
MTLRGEREDGDGWEDDDWDEKLYLDGGEGGESSII